jgi:urease accessory protein
LEAFGQHGFVTASSPPETLHTLLRDVIRHGVGPSDGVALASAHRAADPAGSADLELAVRADVRLTAVKLAREAREASVRTGRVLLGTAIALGEDGLLEYSQLVNEGRAPGNHAVVLGLLDGLLGVPRLDAVAGELFAFAAGWVAAAVRLGMTDHRTAQSLLGQVRPVLVEAAERAVVGHVDQISSCAPLPDVMAMRHEQAELRLFAS